MVLAPTHNGMLGFDGLPLDFTAPRVWVALQARASREQDAADWLRAGRLFAYWPCYAKDVNNGTTQSGMSRRRQRYCALIPGYLFVAAQQGCTADPSIVVSQTPGLFGYVRDSVGAPILLTEKDIRDIKKIENDENRAPEIKTTHSFKTGQKVRFCEGLRGAWPNGVVIGFANDGRIIIEVAALGRAVPFKILPHQIEKM